MTNEIFKQLIDKNIKYNCYVLRSKGSDTNLVYLGTGNFIIQSNFYGLIAYGERHFNYNDDIVTIEYKMIKEGAYPNSFVTNFIKQYEKLLDHDKKIKIVEIPEEEEDKKNND